MKQSFFNDPYFNRAKRYVINTITKEEILLYKDNKIRKLYSSFEELLLDNIEYYSRFIRTILWLYENVLIQDGNRISAERKTRYRKPMTCTKFYYIVMCNNKSTIDEIFYGYPQLGNTRARTFRGLFKHLINIGSFAFNVAYTTERYNTKSFQRAFNSDVTDTEYLYKVCNFVDDILFIDEQFIKKDISSILKISEQSEILYNKINNNSNNNSSTLNILPNKIEYKTIHGDFILTISNNKVEKYITKNHPHLINFDNHINSYIDTIHKINNKRISYNLTNIRILSIYMINEYKSRFIAVRGHSGSTDYSIITIKGMWSMFRATETKYAQNNKIIYERVLITSSPKNVCEALFDNGYYIFGHVQQESELCELINLDSPIKLLNHYKSYINQRFMSSHHKLEMLQYSTKKITKFLIQSYVVG